MLKKITILFMLVAVSAVCFASTRVSGLNVKSCAVTFNGKRNLIKLIGSDKNIGRVEYSKKLGQYVSFAFFPFKIPYSHRRVVRDFLKHLTILSKHPGRYYIDMSHGEFGYYELSDTPMWHPRDVYTIWPEIFRIVGISARVSTVLKTIEMFPLSERTHGDLTQMPKIKCLELDPGEFNYDMFSVEEDLLPSVSPPPDEPVVINRKKIIEDFRKLLSDTKLPYHIRLKQAYQTGDMETIYQIGLKETDRFTKDVCFYYAAIHDHAGANFKVSEKLFTDWKPKEMMLYLRKAVDQQFPEAEFFLAQYLDRFDQGTPEEIFHLFQRSARHGYLDASPALARCYWFGFGTTRNQPKAFKIAKKYLAATQEESFLTSLARTIAGLGYLKFTKEKTRGIKLLQDPDTELGFMAADTVYFYGLYGIPQYFGTPDIGGGVAPHWTPLDVFAGSYPNTWEINLKKFLKYQ